MKVTRFGHSAVLVEADDTRILIDPGIFSLGETFELTGLDAIVVTHQHPDHADPQRLGGLLQRNPQAVVLTDPETAAQFAELTDRVTTHTDGDATGVGTLTITGVGAQHAEILPMIPRVTNVGVLITGPGQPTLFHPGDNYSEAPSGVDVLALPLTAPWTKVAETVDFVRRLAPTAVFPIHDAIVGDAGRGLYWGHVTNHGGAECITLAPGEASTFA